MPVSMVSSGSGKAPAGVALPRTATTQMEEAVGRLDPMKEETTPLVINDVEKGAPEMWVLARKVLNRNVFHIQTIASALKPAWGNPKGLIFRSVGENIFMAELSCKRDRDRVSEGYPWDMSKHDVILMDFVEWT